MSPVIGHVGRRSRIANSQAILTLAKTSASAFAVHQDFGGARCDEQPYELPQSQQRILLHPTSLPGPFGIGDLGPEAYAFADFLEAAGQSLWQVLPLGPTGYGDSPYACYSAFAGNALLISLDELVREGLLTKDDVATMHPFAANRGRV